MTLQSSKDNNHSPSKTLTAWDRTRPACFNLPDTQDKASDSTVNRSSYPRISAAGFFRILFSRLRAHARKDAGVPRDAPRF
jgi:hypothetical protein